MRAWKGHQCGTQRFISNMLCDFEDFSYQVHWVSSESSSHLLTPSDAQKLPVFGYIGTVTVLLF